MINLMRRIDDKNIIFLDFDGVLNHAGCTPETNFTQESIHVLNDIHKTQPIQIVLSTSWKDAYVFSDLVRLLHVKGITAPIIDKTPTYTGPLTKDETVSFTMTEEEFNKRISPDAGRNAEIMHFIKMHNIKHYCILDDFEMTHPTLRKHQVLTSYFDVDNGGLLWKHRNEILRILNEV